MAKKKKKRKAAGRKAAKRALARKPARRAVKRVARKTAPKRTGARRPARGAKKRVAAQRKGFAAVAETSDAPQFSGFDTGSYPDDAVITTWAAKSPYSWVGFYFDAPCHTTNTFKTWHGKFPHIKASGLGVAIIYVGLQQGGCGQANLSRAKGEEHGRDTVTKFTGQGFPKDAVVFLDVEHYNGALSAPMEAYIRGWISAILDSGRITSGIYCPASKANEIRLAAEKEFAAHGLPGGFPVFWVVKVDTSFNIATSRPADSGVSYASMWQGKLDIDETHGGVTIKIDQNVSDSRDPSRAT